jgi:hypothetical protein
MFKEVTESWIKFRELGSEIYLQSISNKFTGAALESLLVYLFYEPMRFAHVFNYLKVNIKGFENVEPLLNDLFERRRSFEEFRNECRRLDSDIDRLGLMLFSDKNIENSLENMYLQVFLYSSPEDLKKFFPKISKRSLILGIFKESNVSFHLLFKGTPEKIIPVLINRKENEIEKSLENILKTLLNEENFSLLNSEIIQKISETIPKSFKLSENVEARLRHFHPITEEVKINEFYNQIPKNPPVQTLTSQGIPDPREIFTKVNGIIKESTLISKYEDQNAKISIGPLSSECQKCSNNPNRNLSGKICLCKFCTECCRKALSYSNCPRCNMSINIAIIAELTPYLN